MSKKHDNSLKYNSDHLGYILSTEAVLCATSLTFSQGFAPFLCTQFSKDIIQFGKHSLIAFDLLNDDDLLTKAIDETTETLAFCGALHSILDYDTTGWMKVGLKTLAGLLHKLADEWYSIADDFHKREQTLIITATYTTQYSIQEVLQNSLSSDYGNLNARIISHGSARAIGAMLRDYYQDQTITLSHAAKGIIKGILYGSKIFFHF